MKVTLNGRNGPVETYALCDGGSTQSWMAPSLKKKLELSGKEVSLNLQSFTGTENVITEELPVDIVIPSEAKTETVNVLVKPDFSIGSDKLNLSALKRKYPCLKNKPEDYLDYSSVRLLLGQTAFHLIRHLEYKYDELIIQVSAVIFCRSSA